MSTYSRGVPPGSPVTLNVRVLSDVIPSSVMLVSVAHESMLGASGVMVSSVKPVPSLSLFPAGSVATELTATAPSPSATRSAASSPTTCAEPVPVPVLVTIDATTSASAASSSPCAAARSATSVASTPDAVSTSPCLALTAPCAASVTPCWASRSAVAVATFVDAAASCPERDVRSATRSATVWVSPSGVYCAMKPSLSADNTAIDSAVQISPASIVEPSGAVSVSSTTDSSATN